MEIKKKKRKSSGHVHTIVFGYQHQPPVEVGYVRLLSVDLLEISDDPTDFAESGNSIRISTSPIEPRVSHFTYYGSLV